MFPKLAVVLCVYCSAVGLFAGVDGLYAASAMPKMWKDTIDTSAHYPCGKPQPRAFKAADLLTNILKTDIIVPHVVVLHRCDSSSGCCASAQDNCWPLGTNRVDFVFVVQSLPMKVRYATYAAVNHTDCTCSQVEASTVHPAPWVR